MGFSEPATTVISNTITSPPNPGGYTGSSANTTPAAPVKKKIRRAAPAALVGAVRPPLAQLFFLWEALVLGAAASLVWARRAKREDGA
jgi:hypothetical protein